MRTAIMESVGKGAVGVGPLMPAAIAVNIKLRNSAVPRIARSRGRIGTIIQIYPIIRSDSDLFLTAYSSSGR